MIRFVLSKMILILWCLPSFAQELLEIDGAIAIKHSATEDPIPGTIQFNSLTKDFEGWNGLFWESLSGRKFSFGEGLDDLDGNHYQTVIIGTQEWMAENLRTTRFKDNSSIPNVVSESIWSTTSEGAWCWFNNNSGLDQVYGKLYNWLAVKDPKGLCPSEWHVASLVEWNNLENYLGGASEAGGKMKEVGTDHWISPNQGATNESGFTGIAGGLRNSAGDFSLGLGSAGFWWSSTTTIEFDLSYYTQLQYSTKDLSTPLTNKKYGMSVRCIKD